MTWPSGEGSKWSPARGQNLGFPFVFYLCLERPRTNSNSKTSFAVLNAPENFSCWYLPSPGSHFLSSCLWDCLPSGADHWMLLLEANLGVRRLCYLRTELSSAVFFSLACLSRDQVRRDLTEAGPLLSALPFSLLCLSSGTRLSFPHATAFQPVRTVGACLLCVAPVTILFAVLTLPFLCSSFCGSKPQTGAVCFEKKCVFESSL